MSVRELTFEELMLVAGGGEGNGGDQGGTGSNGGGDGQGNGVGGGPGDSGGYGFGMAQDANGYYGLNTHVESPYMQVAAVGDKILGAFLGWGFEKGADFAVGALMGVQNPGTPSNNGGYTAMGDYGGGSLHH